jgi:serine/threonine protein kinase/Flp pilus assembly protein TadD
MAHTTSERVKQIFGEAHEIPPSERARFLDGACGGDPRLRAEVDALLSAFDSADEFLVSADDAPSTNGAPSPPANARTESLRAQEGPGTLVGRYKLLQEIGHGGFGTVFMAEQREPIVRKVALKVIKLGMDTRQVIARFEAERQALAMMDHPNIARVLDAGATSTGRPYFVMELVKGVSITRYCDENKLTPRDRLSLFSDVCHAVQHAHQKGVIHRDLKPSNVLISRHDDKPVVKIIDFGIAKAIGGKLIEQTLFTEFHALIGTPVYMSPEQAGMSDLGVDTRSDIYSLGVLLYELLTGTTPFDESTLRRAGQDEIRRMINDVEPPRPSTRVGSLMTSARTPAGETASEGTTSSSSAANIATARHTDAKALVRLLRGDLDWIVMKCLEKDRARRYQTASELANDIRRYLANEPVLAGPPTASYRLRKAVRRHRATVVVGSLVAAVLVLGMIGTSIGLLWALRERDRAESSAQRARRLSEFHAGMLSGLNVERMGRDLFASIRDEAKVVWERRGQSPEIIDAELAKLDGSLADLNATNIAARNLDQGIVRPAEDAVLRDFADDPIAQAHLLQGITEVLVRYGLLERALTVQTQALEIRRRLLGDDHPDALSSEYQFAEVLSLSGRLRDAQAHATRVLEARRRVLGPDHVETLRTLGFYATGLMQQYKVPEAAAVFRELVERARRTLGEDHELTLRAESRLGSALAELGRLDEAEHLLRHAFVRSREVLGEDHGATITAVTEYAELVVKRGNHAEAERLLRETLDRERRLSGDDYPATYAYLHSLGKVVFAQGRLAEAEDLLSQAWKGLRATIGADHIETIATAQDLGELLYDQGKFEAAEPCFREVLANVNGFGEDHPLALGGLGALSAVLYFQGRYIDSEPFTRELVARLRRAEPPQDAHLARSLAELGENLVAQSRFEEAELAVRECITIRERIFGRIHPEMYRLHGARTLLGETISSQGRFAEAEPLLLDGYQKLKDDPRVPPPNPRRDRKRAALERLVKHYEARDRAEPGKGYDAKAAEWRIELEAWTASQAGDTPPTGAQGAIPPGE